LKLARHGITTATIGIGILTTIMGIGTMTEVTGLIGMARKSSFPFCNILSADGIAGLLS